MVEDKEFLSQFKNYSENGIDAASTEDEDHEFDAEKSQKILKKNKEVERIKMNKQGLAW